MDSILMGDSPMRDSRAILEPGTPDQSHMTVLRGGRCNRRRLTTRELNLFKSSIFLTAAVENYVKWVTPVLDLVERERLAFQAM